MHVTSVPNINNFHCQFLPVNEVFHRAFTHSPNYYNYRIHITMLYFCITVFEIPPMRK